METSNKKAAKDNEGSSDVRIMLSQVLLTSPKSIL